MLIRFWGTRGSLPIALTAPQVQAKIAQALLAASGRRFANLEQATAFAAALPFHVGGTFGGHSSCVEIELTAPGTGPHEYIVCDLGSGARPFGGRAMAHHGATAPNTYHVFMSHVHWDHIMGFPLFTPAYVPGNVIRIYGCHTNLEAAFRAQHGAPSFPVDFSQLPARIEFVTLEPDRTVWIAGLRVLPKRQIHAGDSYGYRFEHAGKVFVYSTDSEHKLDDPEVTEGFVDFFRDADLVAFDAMYSFADAISVKEDWGHSSNVVGVELCQLANARRLALFHHEPIHDDSRIANIEAETRRFEEITRVGGNPLDVFAAYDGLEIEL
jgi:phosphoribosyl 1,2-cyclic phosphodiesterase